MHGNPHAFLTYKIQEVEGETVIYIIDLWAHPNYRQRHVASDLADSLIEKEKQTYPIVKLYGSVDMNSNNPTMNMKVLLAYGMKLSHIEGDMIYLEKEI